MADRNELSPILKSGPKVTGYSKTTWNDLRKPNCERRATHVSGFYPRYGRSTVEVTCPFCETDHQVYLWSFSGCGRRCDVCGAIMGHMYAARLMPVAAVDKATMDKLAKAADRMEKKKPGEPATPKEVAQAIFDGARVVRDTPRPRLTGIKYDQI